MGKLNDYDRQIVSQLRDGGILLDADGHRLDQTNGVIMLTCSDGDQMPDIFRYQSDFCQTHRTDPRIHLFALNGGALLLPEYSIINTTTVRQDDVILWNIRVARELKGINTVALYVHAPCGAAALCNLNMIHVLSYLIQAKARLRDTFPGLKVACFCHIDHGPSEDGKPKKRTYFVPVEAAKRWLLARPAI